MNQYTTLVAICFVLAVSCRPATASLTITWDQGGHDYALDEFRIGESIMAISAVDAASHALYDGTAPRPIETLIGDFIREEPPATEVGDICIDGLRVGHTTIQESKETL